ncbi:uncharacterized protein BKCO1_3200092 [Diplodia corticola]|uniref:Uncharacterized protein n=1 Tax=Diplodia corticola TaxID=236234 RepID=A0A1J9RKS1_9PEZI|nr:uncharacterized protein BKCO1_3200092 [Diplodia corticola]OJD33187.1 hypothetical protein BKCO1_3200092 [Diplodia corticola]
MMMPPSAARFVVALLPLFAAAVRAVSLSDFTPRVENLSDQCSTVYNRQINDCSASDLETGENCSVACISGLLSIASQVKSACADDDVAETSIIGVFLLGKGPQILCSNIAATTLGSGHTSTSSTSHSTKQTSTKETSSQTIDAGTTIIAGTSKTAESTTTAAATTTTAESSTSAAETTAAATTTAAESSSESTKAASSSAAATTSSGGSDATDDNDGSGGGSPFDLAVGAGSPRTTSSMCLLGTAMGVWALSILFLS